MNYFPNGNEEIELLKFISKFQYLNISDTKYFFSSKMYYKKRVRNLIEKNLLKKVKSNLMLGEIGIEYVKLFNFKYMVANRNKKYLSRLLQISNLGAFYHKSSIVKFMPSFALKDRTIFTTTARRFIGILEINGFDYLIYKITKEHDKKYIMSVIYDIKKETKYRNIIILTDDLSEININDFTFGMNEVLIIEDNIENREKLTYLHSINWVKVVNKYYNKKLNLSEYSFCEFTDYKNVFITYFYFLDTEKLNRIKQFLRENEKKNIDIICSKEIKEKLEKELPTARYIVLLIEEYIDKERKVYE